MSSAVVATLVLATALLWRFALAARLDAGPVRRAATLAPPPSAPTLPGAPPFLTRRLADADLAVPPDLVWTSWLAGLVVAPVAALLLAGPGLGLLAVLAVGVGPPLALAVLGGRADRRLEAALPEALEAMARSLRSGASLRGAVAEAAATTPGRLGGDLRVVAAATASGAPLVAALDAWADRRPLPAVRLAVAALALGAETGGAQARAVDGVAETVRSRLAVAGEVRALSSQARLSALVIAAAPIAFALLATGTDGRTAAFLFRTPAGLACLAGGLVLDALAAVWMHRLTAVRP